MQTQKNANWIVMSSKNFPFVVSPEKNRNNFVKYK